MMALWFIEGLLGGTFFWLSYKLFEDELDYPTPRAILLILVVSALGPVTLMAAIGALIGNLIGASITWSSRFFRSDWWRTPIIRRKRR